MIQLRGPDLASAASPGDEQQPRDELLPVELPASSQVAKVGLAAESPQRLQATKVVSAVEPQQRQEAAKVGSAAESQQRQEATRVGLAAGSQPRQQAAKVGSAAEPQQRQEATKIGSGAEPPQRQATKLGNANEPPLRQEATKLGSAAEPPLRQEAAKLGNAAEPPLRQAAKLGNAAEPPLRQEAAKLGNAAEPPLRQAAKRGNANEPPLRQEAAKLGNANEPPLRQEAAKLGNAAEPPLRQEAAKLGNANEPPLRQEAAKLGNAAEPPLRQEAAKLGNANEPPLQQEATKLGIAAEPQERQEATKLDNAAEPPLRLEATKPVITAEPQQRQEAGSEAAKFGIADDPQQRQEATKLGIADEPQQREEVASNGPEATKFGIAEQRQEAMRVAVGAESPQRQATKLAIDTEKVQRQEATKADMAADPQRQEGANGASGSGNATRQSLRKAWQPSWPTECGPSVTFAMVAENSRCPQNEQRIAKYDPPTTLENCLYECLEHPTCAQFSWASSGEFAGVCILCHSTTWEGHVGFEGYYLCERQPTTTLEPATSAPTTVSVVTTAPGLPGCGPEDPPYAVVETGYKCPYDKDLRLFTEDSVDSAQACYQRCLATFNCGQFSWSAIGPFKHICMGCAADAGMQNHTNFTLYRMCEAAASSTDPAICKLPSAEFKVCTLWGDPHYSTSFYSTSATFDFQGVGVYKLASTTNGAFELQAFQCPFSDRASAVAGLAWRIGSTVVSVIEDVVAVNGTNVTEQGGQLINPEYPMPAGLDISGAPEAGGIIFQSSDTCVRVRVQKRSLDSARAGYILNEQLLIASGFAAEAGLCGDDTAAARVEVPPSEFLFTAEQTELLCNHCRMDGCAPREQGMIPEISPPSSYNPAATTAEVCSNEPGLTLADASAACAALESDATFYEACRFDYCASHGDSGVVANAMVSQWEEAAATAGVGIKPFSYTPLPSDAPAFFYGMEMRKVAAVPGTCAEISDVPQLNQTDCTPMGSYTCASITNLTVGQSDDETTIRLGFTGSVATPLVECGEGGTCPLWTAHKTCGGLFAKTVPAVVQGGSCVRGELASVNNFYPPGGIDWFEVGVAIFDEEHQVVDSQLLRGQTLQPRYFQFQVVETQSLYVDIYSASYDYDGDGNVGHMLEVKNVVHGPCLPTGQLALGPSNCLVDGSTAELSEDDFFLLAECCCDLEMEIFIRRYAQHLQLQECIKGTIWGMVPYYTCVHGTQSLARLREDLWAQTNGTQWVSEATEGSCQGLSLDCSQADTAGCPSISWMEGVNMRVPCGRFR